MEAILEKLETELQKAIVNPNYKTTENMREGLLKLWTDPDSEKGKPLPWKNVELSLKNELYLLTGIPSSGKSTWLDNVIVSSIKDHRKKWAIFSPESHPVELHLKQLIEIFTHTNFYGAYNYPKTSQEEIDKAIYKLSRSVYMMTPTDENLTIEALLELVEFLIEEHGVNSFVLDPYNEFSHTRPSGMSETEYVSRFLGRVRQFVNKHDVMAWIVAHPTKLRKEEVPVKGGGTILDYPCPTAYDIAGSANFFNKADCIIAVHRDKDINRNPDNLVDIVVQKVRRKTTGKLGTYTLKFNYNDGTYTEAM